jgi:hypothetical protein
MLRILDVPQYLLPKMPIQYPPHQKQNPMIEEKFLKYFSKNYGSIKSDLIYIPIQWTAYHLLNNYGENLELLNGFISDVFEKFSGEKFFTFVQYDGGTLVELNNCRIFACSGSFASKIGKNSSYEPIPLYSDPHRVWKQKKKSYKAVFMGRITHDIRKKMLNSLSGIEGFKLQTIESNKIDKSDVRIFKNLISKSIFGLCPRGYGPTSFRLYETIQLGSIPIIISDDFWLPFKDQIKWSDLALLVSPKNIDNIPSLVDELIESGKYKLMIEYGKDCWTNYLSWDGIQRSIVESIAN